MNLNLKHTFNVRLDDDGKARLIRLAAEFGIAPADAARLAIKQMHDFVVAPNTK